MSSGEILNFLPACPLVSRARCGILHAAAQNRDPGSNLVTGAPDQQRITPQRGGALRSIRGTKTVDSNQPFALSLARPSASSAVPPFAEPLLPFSVTVALVSDDPLRFSTVTVFSSFVTLMSQVLSGQDTPTPNGPTGSCVH